MGPAISKLKALMRNKWQITPLPYFNLRRNNVNAFSSLSTKQVESGAKLFRLIQLTLIVLFLTCALLASGCASNLQTQESVTSQVVVDQSLMEEPNYQTELLNFLSDKPKEPTTK